MGKALWTSIDAAAATGGRAVGEWSVTGLSIDTRSIQSGDLFVPLKDARDGHAFIPQARKVRSSFWPVLMPIIIDSKLIKFCK